MLKADASEIDRQIDAAGLAVTQDILPIDLRDHRILVTGATGLIGRVMCAALRRLGAEVGEFSSKHTLQYCLDWSPDHVVHAAGYAQPTKFLTYPMATLDLNTRWLIDLIDAVDKKGGRILYLSSSEVYSGSPHLRHVESDIGQTSPAHPRGCYIEAKRCGEAIVHAARASRINAVVARVSLVYGPGVQRKDTRVMSQFIEQALHSGEIVLQDGGQARRTYCYVTDTVAMLINIMWRGKSPVYNVGGEGEITILSLARRIAGLMKVPTKVPRGMGVAQTGAPAHVSLDTGLYRREFGKRQYVPLEEGLKQTIAWHKALAGLTGEDR